MRCNDCTPHVLDGSLSVCSVVEFAWSRAHVVYASAWVCRAIFFCVVSQLKQTPFCSKMASHTSSVLLRSLYLSPSQMDVHAICLSPNNEQVHFSHEVFVVGIHVECLVENAWLWSDHKNNQTYTAFVFVGDLTLFPVLLAVEPPSDLKFKILNENSVEMSWTRPSTTIEGYRIQVVSDTGQYGVNPYCILQHTHY